MVSPRSMAASPRSEQSGSMSRFSDAAAITTVPLGAVADVRTGLAKGKSASISPVELPYLRVANVQDGYIDLKTVKRVLVEERSISRYSLQPGDVLLTEGGDIDKLGRGTVWRGELSPCLHQNHVFAVRPRCDVLDSNYLAAVAASDYGRKYFLSCAKRTTNLASINSTQLKAFPVPLRPLDEQKKIAAILAQVDDKLSIVSRQIEVVRVLKRGIMQSVFSGGVGNQDSAGRWAPHAEFKDSEVGRIPLGWTVCSLGSITHELRERNSGKLDDALLCGVSKEQGLMPMRERVKGATTDRCRIVAADAFAYNPMRINIGSIAKNDRDHSVMVSPDYVVFAARSQYMLPAYLDHFRRSDEWQRFVGRSGAGGVRIRIYYGDLAKMMLKVPPLREQAKVIEVLDAVTAKLAKLEGKQRETRRLKRGLMQKLLPSE